MTCRSVPWLESFGSGDVRIDAEHRAIIELSNHLCALAAADAAEHVIRSAARALIASAEAHFASEEALFPVIGYRRQLSHMREHLAIQQSLGGMLSAKPGADLAAAAEAGRQMLVDHLLRHDLGFKTWIQHAAGR